MNILNSSRTRMIAIGAVILTGLALGGCESELPEVTVSNIESAAVTLDQSTRILADVNEVLSAATEAMNPALLSSRVTGPALYVRTKQLEVAQIIGNTDLVTELPDDYLQVLLPSGDEWPRVVFAITAATEDLLPPRLVALWQEAPRAPYRLWGWAFLRPGAQMPNFANPAIGSEMVAVDDDTLLASPQDIVAQYIDLLTLGEESAFAAIFEPAADDPYRTLIADATAVRLAQFDPNDPLVGGGYSWSFEQAPGTTILGMRAYSGGALVIAAIDATEIMSVVEGAFINWPSIGTANALLGGQEPTNYLVQGFSDMIVLYIPPAGSTEPVMLLGYSHVQTYASNQAPTGGNSNEEENGQ
ncbi:MAG: hypothetical protein FWD83_02290 [Promicromonosporaceae bacterium]|nr:hypothetical protein [Promicromonosporaceae bacterium]